MRKLKVKLLPNNDNKTKWYYKNKYKFLLERSFIVTELDNGPIFKNHYRFDGGSLFIEKNDCEIMEIPR